MVAAVPLLKDAWKETFEEKRFTIHQFLAFALLLGIFAGEALTAFEIIYVLRGAKLLEDYAADRSRRGCERGPWSSEPYPSTARRERGDHRRTCPRQ